MTAETIPFGQVYAALEYRGFRFVAHRAGNLTLRDGGDQWVIRESWPGGPCAIDHYPFGEDAVPNWSPQGQDYWPGREAAMDALADHLMERLVGAGL